MMLHHDNDDDSDIGDMTSGILYTIYIHSDRYNDVANHGNIDHDGDDGDKDQNNADNAEINIDAKE